MSTGYGWEGIRQVCVTLLGVRHVPEASVVAVSTWGTITSVQRFLLRRDLSHCPQSLNNGLRDKRNIDLVLLEVSSHSPAFVISQRVTILLKQCVDAGNSPVPAVLKIFQSQPPEISIRLSMVWTF